MSDANWAYNLLRMFFSQFNQLIYSFIETLYNFLMTLADVRVFSFDTLKTFSTRIYAILGIFMAFKLTFTFITYAVNPEKMTDKSTGGRKLVINIIGSLILLISVPNLIFPLSRELQTALLSDHILEQVILGTDPTVGGNAVDTKRAGRYLSFSVLNGFFYPDENLASASDSSLTCKNASMILDPEITNQDPSSQTELDKAIYKLNGDCAAAMLDQVDNAGDTVFWYETAYTQKSIAMLLGGKDATNLKIATTKDDQYVFQFNYIFSLVVGVIVVFMLINFCFKIAVRTIKLGFLELVAPIPILSFIDPSSKKKSFDGWVKTCISTYLDLFIRLAALYFAIFMITQITTGSNPLTYSDGRPVGGFVTVVIIIGALMFANQIPDLIKSILGVDLKGGFSLNPFKDSKLATGVLGGVAGGLVASATGVAGNLAAHRQNGDFSWQRGKRLSSIKSGLGGVTSGILGGGARGLVGGVKSKGIGKGFGSGFKSGSVGGKKIQEMANTTFWGRNAAKVQNKVHMKTAGEKLKDQTKTYTSYVENMGKMKTGAEKYLEKHNDYKTASGKTVANLREEVNKMRNDPTKTGAEIAKAETEFQAAKKEAITEIQKDFTAKFIAGKYGDIDSPEFKNAIAEIQKMQIDNPEFFKGLPTTELSTSNINDFIDKSKGDVDNKNFRMLNSQEYKEATANTDYAKNVIGPHEHPHGK